MDDVLVVARLCGTEPLSGWKMFSFLARLCGTEPLSG